MAVQYLEPVPKNRQRIAWTIALFVIYSHLVTLYSVICLPLSWTTLLYHFILANHSALSVTGGLHRLWAHKAYSAAWPLKVFYLIGHLQAFQLSTYKWVQYHRIHHKYTDTNSDPHNSKRGLFYSHVGWYCCRMHEDVIEKFKTVDMSDLEADFLIRWQHRFYPILAPLISLVIPTLIPVYLWGESAWVAWHWSVVRFVVVINSTSLVNSVAHSWGMKPYDKNISATELASVSFITCGEGWHNYHHVFPWDYKAAELGRYSLNTTTAFLDLCGKLGLAWDFKTATPEMIKKRMLRTGEGSKETEVLEYELTEEEKGLVSTLYPSKKAE